MVRKEGKVYEAVIEALRARGARVDGVSVATGNRGPYHLILQDDEIIGEYNHVSHRVFLYENIVKSE